MYGKTIRTNNRTQNAAVATISTATMKKLLIGAALVMGGLFSTAATIKPLKTVTLKPFCLSKSIRRGR